MTDNQSPDTITVPASRPLPWILVGALASVVVLLGALLLAPSADAAEGDTAVVAPVDSGTADSAEVESDDSNLGDSEECPGHHRKHRWHHMAHGASGEESGQMAELIGIEPDALREALQSGQSLADVAVANGVELQTLIDAIAAGIQDRVDAAFDAGRIDAEKAEQLRADAFDIAERIVNHEPTKLAMGHSLRNERTVDGAAHDHGHRRGGWGRLGAFATT